MFGLSIFVVSFTPSIFPFFMIVLKALGDKKVIVLKEMQMNLRHLRCLYCTQQPLTSISFISDDTEHARVKSVLMNDRGNPAPLVKTIIN